MYKTVSDNLAICAETYENKVIPQFPKKYDGTFRNFFWYVIHAV